VSSTARAPTPFSQLYGHCTDSKLRRLSGCDSVVQTSRPVVIYCSVPTGRAYKPM